MKQRVIEIRFNSNVSPFSPDLRQQHLPSFHVPASPPTLAVSRKPWLFSLEHPAPVKLPPHHDIDASRYSSADTPTATGQTEATSYAGYCNTPRRRCKQHLTSWLPTRALCEEVSDLQLGLGSGTYAAFICLLGAPREDEPSWLWCGRQWPTFFRAEQF